MTAIVTSTDGSVAVTENVVSVTEDSGTTYLHDEGGNEVAAYLSAGVVKIELV